MLRIRLARVGAKRQPSYRIVVADVNAKRDGRIVERIGHYNPRTDPITYKIDEGRALYWLSVGAQPSDAVNRLLTKQGTIDRLGRLRQGEGLDTLVAEFEGKPAPVKSEEPATIVETVKETVAQAVGSAVEAVGEAIEAAGEAIAGHPAEETVTEEESAAAVETMEETTTEVEEEMTAEAETEAETAAEAASEEETAEEVEAEPTVETEEPVAEAATSGAEA
jgi:small subunit ribosomal protein S16